MTSNPTLPPIQTGPAAWIGADIAQHPDEWQIQLTAAEIAELEAAADRFLNAGGRNGAPADTSGIGTMTQQDFALPTLGPKLLELRRELIRGRGFALLRGLPVANYTERESVTIFYAFGSRSPTTAPSTPSLQPALARTRLAIAAGSWCPGRSFGCRGRKS